MADNNEGTKLSEAKKQCPALKAACIQARCEWWVLLTRKTPGPHGGFQTQNLGKCAVPALCEIMSSLQA